MTRQGYWWFSRLRAKTSYEVRHVFYQRDGVLDALVWLGRYRADRAAYAVRLVQVTHAGRTWAYLTNVLDPRQLSLHDLSALYARRWDIERMFNLVKTHLHLHWLWSGHLSGVCTRCIPSSPSPRSSWACGPRSPPAPRPTWKKSVSI